MRQPAGFTGYIMRISANDKKIKQQTTIGRVAVYGSLGILIAGVLLSLFGQNYGLFKPENIGLFYVIYFGVLIVGFGLSRVGMYYGNRFLMPTRPELMLREKLKGMDRKYALMLFQTPVDYYLVEPGGVTAFIVKNQGGPVSYRNGVWKRKSNILGGFFGREEPLGNPTAEATEALNKLNTAITANNPGLKVPQRAVIVFTNPSVQLDVEPSPIMAMKIDDLKDFLRGEGKLKDLPNSIQRKMRDALGAPELEKLDE